MKTLSITLLLLSTAPALATTAAPGNTTIERKQTTTVERDDNGFGDWGLLGLLGLGGLAGLLKKDRVRNPDGTYTTTRK